MEKSRLVEVLNSFNKKDFRDFRKFVSSPYFNQREDVVLMFDYLAEQLALKKTPKLGKQEIYNKIFPKQKYDEKKISYTMSFLYNNIKLFLANQEFSNNPLNTQLYLAKALRKRGLNRQFETEIKAAEYILEKSELRQMDFHYLDYCVHEEKYNYSITKSREEAEQFQILTDKLTVFFVANKLRHGCASLSHKSLSTVALKQDLLPEVLKHVEENDYSHLADVSIYYHSYKALTSNQSNTNFEQLRFLINKEHARFSPTELKEIYLFAINYCIHRLNSGDRSFLREVFEVYKEGLAHDIFIENGFLSRYTYNNIVKAAVGLKEFSWAENFLIEYKSRIEKKHRESNFNFNLAILYHRQSDYIRAMELLQKVVMNDSHLNLNARRMLLKIYFDQEEYDALNSLLDSFKNFIYRHKDLKGVHKSSYLNFIRFTRKLLQLKKYDKEAKAKLNQMIKSEKYLVERDWLLGQLG